MALTEPVALGAWTPDQPAYRAPSLIRATNVMPREDGFYGPANALAVITSALAARCRGAVSLRDASGSSITFAGTDSALYKLNSSNAWGSVASGFSMAAEDRWQWSAYDSSLIATGGLNVAPQLYDLSTGSSFGALSSGAPNARYSAVINDFVVLASTYTATQGVRENQIWWSAKGVPTSWPEPGTDDAISVQSSFRQIPDGGALQGILGGVGGADGAIFGENRIWRMQYVGPRTIFQIDPTERNRGVYAAGSLVQVGRMAYYLAEDGWFSYDGVQSVPIGTAKWDQFFLDDLDDGNKAYLWSAVDTDGKVILCAYPGSGNTGGIPNRIFAINYQTGNASVIEVETEVLIGLKSAGYTLEGLGAIYPNLELVPFSLDSRAWAGGGSYIGGCSTDHAIGQFNGATLQADLTTSEWSSPDHNRVFVSGVRPVCDATNVQAALSHREEMGQGTALTTTGYTTRAGNRICPHTVSTRYVRTLLRVPAGEAWSSVQAIQYDVQPDGDT